MVLTGRRMDRLQALADEIIAQSSVRVLPLRCDVTQEGAVEAAVLAAVQDFGRLDLVIANAGFGVTGYLEKLGLEDYRRQFETNVFGVLRTIYATLEELKKSKGTLVLMGSVAGYVSLPGSSPYSMSKFSVHALANSITPELQLQGVSVVLIAPGFVESEIRRVDNHGQFHSDAQDTFPKWLTMPTGTAATQIMGAVATKRAEKIITQHGRLAVFVKRHFPGMITFLAKRGLRGRGKVLDGSC